DRRGRRCRARRGGCGRCARRSPSRRRRGGGRRAPRPWHRSFGGRSSSPETLGAAIAPMARKLFQLRPAPLVTRAPRRPSVLAVLATARTFTLDGIAARPVRVEV